MEYAKTQCILAV